MHKRSLHGTQAALTMAFASCAQYEHVHFTAYARLAQGPRTWCCKLDDVGDVPAAVGSPCRRACGKPS